MNYDVNACEELCEIAPEFAESGVTDAICASLQANTGLNPYAAVLSDNITDLPIAIDCLIGRLDDEVDCYETCDWKAFMHNMIPRFYTMMKAFVCAETGLWEKAVASCEQIQMQQEIGVEIVNPVNSSDIGAKFEGVGTPPSDFGIKLLLNELTAESCDGLTETFGLYGFYISSGWQVNTALAIGDKIASWTKAELVPAHMSNDFWDKWLTSGYSNTFCFINNQQLVQGILEKHGDDVDLMVEALVGTSSTGLTQSIHSPIQTIQVS